MNIVQPVKTIKCIDYKCPLPQVQAKEALAQIEEMEIIEIWTTDIDAERELRKWTKQTGDFYLFSDKKDMCTVHYIQKAPSIRRKEAPSYEKIILNDDLEQKMKNRDSFILVDVREEIEYIIGHVPGAIHIPLGDLKEQLNQLDKEKTYYIICRTGNRSDFACQLLVEAGFTNVYNVLPGMSEWNGEIEE